MTNLIGSLLCVLLFLSGCGISKSTLLKDLSLDERIDLCEGLQEDAAGLSIEDTCRVTAANAAVTLGMGSELCQQTYDTCLTQPTAGTYDCSMTWTTVPDDCTATVGDARDCSSDTVAAINDLGASLSCDALPDEVVGALASAACLRLARCGQ